MAAPTTAESFAGFLRNYETLRRFGERYRADAALRDRIAGGDHSDLDAEIREGVEVRVVQQTAEVRYFLLPPDPNARLQDQALESVAGGTSESGNAPLSSVGTVGSLGSIPSTVSSAGSAGSISSVQV